MPPDRTLGRGGRDFFALAEKVIERDRLGTGAQIRFNSLRLRLLERGVEPGDPRILDWVGPAVSSSADQLRAFSELNPLSSERYSGGLAGSSRQPKTPKTPETPLDWRKAWWIGAAAVAVVLLAIAIASWDSPNGLDPDSQDPDTSIDVDIPTSNPEDLRREDRGDPMVSLAYGLGALALAATMFLVIHLLAWRIRRRRHLADLEVPAAQSARVGFGSTVDDLFDDDPTRAALHKLRRHWSAPDKKIDVKRSIAATVGAGGIPHIQFGTRKQTPEYLILAEREDPRDHLTQLARSLSKAMEEEDVAHLHFEYYGTPQTLQLIRKGEPGKPVSLALVLDRQPDARPLVISESFDCIAGATDPKWLEAIGAQPDAALLNPREEQYWDDAEAYLHRNGFEVVAVCADGLSAYGDNITNESDTEIRPKKFSHGRFDLPESLALDRDIVLDEIEPEEFSLQGIAEDLEAWLSPLAMLVLRTSALFPRIEPRLTYYLTEYLSDGSDPAPIDQSGFVELARLPWMRSARMPGWLRRTLVGDLDRKQLDRALEVITAYALSKDAGAGSGEPLDIEKGRDPRNRELLRDWLIASGESALHDPILIDALEGCGPATIAEERHGRRFRIWRWLKRHFFAGAFSREAIWSWWIFAWTVVAAIVIYIGMISELEEPEQAVEDLLDIPAELEAVEDAAQAVEEEIQDAIPRDVPRAQIEGVGQPTSRPDGAGAVRDTGGVGGDSRRRPTRRSDGGVGEDAPAGRSTAEVRLPATFIVFFDWDRSDITPEAAQVLDRVLTLFDRAERAGRSPRIEITGHYDRSNTATYAVSLSDRLAVSVRSYLVAEGVPDSAITWIAMGESQPRVPTPDGVREAQNRRAEIVIIAEDPPAAAN